MVARDWVSRKLKEGILVPDFNLNLKPPAGEKHQVFPLFSLFFFFLPFFFPSLPFPFPPLPAF
jgi:hypothetical protein